MQMTSSLSKKAQTKLIAEEAPKVWDFLLEYMRESGELETYSAEVMGDMVLEAFPTTATDEARLAFFDLRELSSADVEKAVRSAFPSVRLIRTGL